MSFLKSFLANLRGESASIGVDVGHKSIKAVKIHHKSKKSVFMDKIEIAIDEGVLVDGEINQPEVLGEKILAALEYLKFDESIDDIYFSISWSAGILADRVMLKFPKGSDEEEVILFEAGNRPPFDEKDITLDYQVLATHEAKETKEVLLVAAKNSLLQKWARFLDTYQIHPYAFDVDTFAVYNTFQKMKHKEGPEVVGLLSIGQQRTNITFVIDGQYHSTRIIQGNVIQEMSKSLARKLNVNTKDAVNFLFGRETPSSQGEKAITSMWEDLARSIQQSNQFFQSTSKGRTLNRILISGGGAYLSGICEVLNGQLNAVDVQVMTYSESADLKPEDPTFAVAYGLALRNA